MAKSNMETDSTFTCIICLDHPKEPVNCRYCTKFVCTSCIDSWFEKSANDGIFSCPNCRKLTQRSEFIRLAWLPDHLEWINDRTKEFERTKMNECSQHAKQELCIYCITCTKAICAQCILPIFNGEHSDHNYSRLDAAQQHLFMAINTQEKDVQSDLDQMNICIQNKKLIIGQILIRKKERLTEVKEFQTKIRTQIKFEATKLLKKYRDETNILIEARKVLEKYHGEQKTLIEDRVNYDTSNAVSKEAIESCNQIELFERQKELFQQISQRPKVPLADKVDLPGDMVGSPLTLPWQTGEFVVDQFSIKQKNSDRIASHQIRLDHNQHWTIIIYPNGKGLDTGVYLSIMLQLNKGISQSIDYNIIIELIHHHHDDNRHNYSFKSIKSFKEGQSNGYDQFYKLNDLSNDGFLDLDTDSIKFRFKLCPKSIFEERKLFQWEIESFNQNEQNRDEQNYEMNKIKYKLTHLKQDYREANRMIEDQRFKIEQLERNNSELKRKQTRSNDDLRDKLINQEDHRSDGHRTRTVIFGNEKRFKK